MKNKGTRIGLILTGIILTIIAGVLLAHRQLRVQAVAYGLQGVFHGNGILARVLYSVDAADRVRMSL